MEFDSYEHREEFLESFGIKEGDEVRLIVDNPEFSNKRGIVMEMKLWFSNEPLYLISLPEYPGRTYKENRFLRKDIELVYKG